MIIPTHYIELLEKRDTLGYLASLKENQFCDVCRTSGVYVMDQEFLKVFYMPALSPGLYQNLLLKQQMTVTIVSAFTFECYQFKGAFYAHESLSTEDEAFRDSYLKGMVEVIGELGFDLERVLKDKYTRLDVEAIVMKVEEIYEQTPKKGAGKKVKL